MKGNEKMSEIKFKSKWFEKCIRDYLQIQEGPITQEQLNVIKYFTIETTHSLAIEFGNEKLPEKFKFMDAGDEWYCCCISDTGQYSDVESFIDIETYGDFTFLRIKEEALEAEEALKEAQAALEDEADHKKTAKEIFLEEKEQRAAMKAFMSTVKTYWPEEKDYAGIEEDENACNSGMIFPEDFAHLKNVEVLRLKTCEWDVHTLKFLKELPNVKVLEVGEVRLTDLEGIEKLVGLDKLTIWAN